MQPGTASPGDAKRSGRPPSFTPVQVAAVKALAAKLGSVMKIQDWYCQGLIASSPSPRLTVEVDIRRGDPIGDDLSGQVHITSPSLVPPTHERVLSFQAAFPRRAWSM